jgi:hypothetical protein
MAPCGYKGQTDQTMKYLLSVVAACMFIVAAAQKPEPIYSFARKYEPLSFYREQRAAWKKAVEANPKDAWAWYNYYRATRNLVLSDTLDTRDQAAKHEDQVAVVNEMAKAVPLSFEYYICRNMIEGNTFQDLTWLKKAHEAGPDRVEHFPDMITWGETSRDLGKRNTYANKWYESNESSPGMLYYNFNVLNGLKPGAILLTIGDNDTYPAWMLQSLGVRQDVTVINTSLILLDSYRDALFKELGVEKWSQPLWSENGSDTLRSESGLLKFQKGLVKHLAGNKKHRPVYVSMTASGTCYTENAEANLYLTGLAYEYAERTFDNMAVLKRNFEHEYALDYIDKPFYHDISRELVFRINNNYTVPMIKLYDHYRDSGDSQKQEWIREKLLQIAKHSPDEKEILSRIKQ